MASNPISTGSDSSALGFTAHFEDVTDPRSDWNKEHAPLNTIGLTICAVVAGADTLVGISRPRASREEWLKQFSRTLGRDSLSRYPWEGVEPVESGEIRG